MLSLGSPAPTDKIRILLADDHQNVRSQVRLRLGRERDFQVIAEATNSAQAIERARSLSPRIALIDPMMGDGLGLQSVRWMADHLPGTAVVVLTAVADTALQIELRKMGVCRILNKGIASSELVGILRDIGNSDSSPGRLRHSLLSFPD